MAEFSGEISLGIQVDLVFSGIFPLTLSAVTDRKVLLGINDDPEAQDGRQTCGLGHRQPGTMHDQRHA